LKAGRRTEQYEPEIQRVVRLLTQILKTTYIYRKIPFEVGAGPGFITIRDGDQITFGGGQEAARLGSGPNALLCNFQLAVARVLEMSGAAELIAEIIEDGDDSDFNHVYISSPAFCDILTAKLLSSGRALIY